MSWLHKLAVVAVVVLLTTTVVAANAVVATHRTMLNPDFVTGTLEDENGYELLDDAVQQAVASSLQSEASGSSGLGSSDVVTGVVDRAVTRDYVESQIDRVIVRLYAFLHGERQELTLPVRTDPVVERVPPAMEAEMENTSLSTLLEATGTDPRNGSALGEGSLGSAGPSVSELARMERNRSSYREVRSEFRAAIRERAIAEAANRTYRNASDDRLLALVVEDYDPDAYSEAEKERMVRDRESEIKAALRERVRADRSDRINETVDERLGSLAAESTTDEDPGNVTQAGGNLQAVLVQGLAGDMSYSTFDRKLTAAKGDLGRQLGERFQGNLDEQLPATISPTENVDADTRQQFDRAQRVVGIVDALGVALPLAALALVGLLWWLTRSPSTVATATGGSLLVAGLPAWLGAEWAANRARTFVAENAADAPEAGRELALGFAEAVTGTIAAQSLLIGLVGAGLLAVGLAIRYGYLDVDGLPGRGEGDETTDEG